MSGDPNGEAAAPTVALLPWGHVIEDFLAPERLSLDEFAEEFTGSWMFGYADALATAGVRTSLVLFSAEADERSRRVHVPTGAAISVLPAPAAFRAVRSRASNLYARSGAEAFARSRGRTPVARLGRSLAREVAPYLATPVRALARELRALGAHALLSQEYESPQFDAAVAAGMLARVPVSASFQGGDYQRYRAERLIRSHAIRRARRLIVPTLAEAARLRRRYGVDAARIERIFNPVDLETWRPRDGAPARARLELPEAAPVVAWHGRVSVNQKGLDVLVDAWRMLERSWDQATHPYLLLVGGGRDSDVLDRLVREAGLERVVRVPRLVHDREELAALLSAADLYVLPSRHEGFPVALVEALACGLPAVAADANGVRDILENGESAGGVVVARGDAEALAGALRRMLADRPRLESLGSAARAAAGRRFAHDVIGRQLAAALLPHA